MTFRLIQAEKDVANGLWDCVEEALRWNRAEELWLQEDDDDDYDWINYGPIDSVEIDYLQDLAEAMVEDGNFNTVSEAWDFIVENEPVFTCRKDDI